VPCEPNITTYDKSVSPESLLLTMTASSPSLKRQAIKGTLWTLLSFGLGNVLRLVSNVCLFQLLGPGLLGLMNLVNTVMTGLNMFSDVGLGPNIVQSKRGDDPKFLNTAWTLQIARNAVLFLFCCALAFPAARFYERSEILWLLPVVGINTLISGFQSTAIYTLSRNLSFRQSEVYGLCESLITITVMLTLASLYPSVWALVLGGTFSAFFRIYWTHRRVAGITNSLFWEHESFKELFSLGKWFFFSTAVTFLGLNADRLILGKLISNEMLGLYAIAITLSDLPKLIVGAISSKILLPTMSKLSHLPREEFRQGLLKYRQIILLLAAALLAVFVCFGDLLITALYGWRPQSKTEVLKVAWMVPILAAGIWPNLLHESIRQSLVAIGQPKYEAVGQLLKCLLVCLGVPGAFYFMKSIGSINPILGPVIVVALNDLPLFAALSVGLRRQGLNSLKQDITLTGVFVGLSVGLICIRWILLHSISIQTLFRA
jgi:O-antigen/teichoic acid export membrane protein